MMETHRRARTLAQQVGDELIEAGAHLVGRSVKDCLPSSRLDDGPDGRTLVLRYGPSKEKEQLAVMRATTLVVETLAGIDDGEGIIAVRTEATE